MLRTTQCAPSSHACRPQSFSMRSGSFRTSSTRSNTLTHEVAYGELLHDRRRALHARVTEAIERLTPERIAERSERLAHHALRGELWEKAVAYLRQAGLRAMARA